MVAEDPATPTASFAPYVVEDSGVSVDAVFAGVNEAVWYGYGPDYRAGGAAKIVAGAQFDFTALLRELTAIDHARFVSHIELLGTPCGPDEIRIAIRHDIDTDIVAAAQQAEIERDFGVVANWVVLHTAPYYGAVDAETKRFVRNDSMIEVYKRFQELGHEVSLHADPLGLYQFHDIDGAEGLVTELEWLRSHGIEIRGTTAHNHRPTYGAENYEIFKGFVSPQPNALSADTTWVTHRGKGSPLRVLDEVALGFEYEGNEVFWREDWDREYGSARFSNLWFWTDHQRRRKADPDMLDREFLDQSRVLHQIRNLRPGTDVVLVIHPEYFGARSGHDQRPADAHDHTTVAPNAELGWQTYVPWSVATASRHVDDQQISQAFNVANEWGMLDLPIPDDAAASLGRRVLVAGGHNVDAANVAVPSQVHARTAQLAAEKLHNGAIITKLAHGDMAIDRLWPWISHGIDQIAPDTVVLGVDSLALDEFGPTQWAAAASAAGLAGHHLAVDGRGGVSERSFTPADLESSVADQGLSGWSGAAACYQWVIAILRSREIRPVLMLESSTGDPDAWSKDPRRLRVHAFAADAGVLLADPTVRIAREDTRLNSPDISGEWGATAHRIASEELFATLFPNVTPAGYKSNLERRRDSIDARLAAQPAGSALGLPTAAAAADHDERLENAGILPFPSPFTSAISIIGDIDGSSTEFYGNYMGELVGDLGLDHGDSIHFAGYHQRYSKGRRGLVTRTRAIVTYDLRRDNAPLAREPDFDGICWLAHVLREYHRGNIDHLHGLYAWGARSLPLHAETGDAARGRLFSVLGRQGENPSAEIPYAYDADNFPIVSIAVELTPGTEAPEELLVRYRNLELDESPGIGDEDAPQRRPSRLGLVSTRQLLTGTSLAVYTAEAPIFEPVVPGGPNCVVPLHDITGFEIDTDPGHIVSAAMHNTDTRGLRHIFNELRERFNVVFDLITAHGRYHFYSHEGLDGQSKELARLRDVYGPELDIALFANPENVGAAAQAVADDPNSAAQVFPALTREGVRYLIPCGLIAINETRFDHLNVAFPVIDRSGNAMTFLRRTRPELAWEPEHARHDDFSRLSTFENRLRHVLDLIDQGEQGIWPLYTHLGQTADLDNAPDPWFGDGVAAELADRYFGSPHSGTGDTDNAGHAGPAESAARVWVTRASVLANYASMIAVLPDLTIRRRHHIEISRRLDPMTGQQTPESITALWGMSYTVDNPDKTMVTFDGIEVEEFVRWHDRNEITLASPGIRWELIDQADPVLVAAHDGDLDTATVDHGTWTWDSGRQDGEPMPFGQLRPHATTDQRQATPASLRITLDQLNPTGAQVAGIRLRKSHTTDSVTVRLGMSGGGIYEISESTTATNDEVGHFRMRLRAGDWCPVVIPLWGFSWTKPMPTGRTIEWIEITTTGADDSFVDIAGAYLGRPRTSPPGWATNGPRIGGDAFGRDEVRLRRLDATNAATDAWRCVVDADGLFSSPSLAPGCWLVETTGAKTQAIQVRADRFDVMFDAPEGASNMPEPRAVL